MSKGLILLVCILFSSCDAVKRFEARAARVNNYGQAALELSKENRVLQAEISDLKYQLEILKSKNSYLQLQLDKSKGVDRSPASVKPVDNVNDLVKQTTFKWGPKELVATGQKEFELKSLKILR